MEGRSELRRIVEACGGGASAEAVDAVKTTGVFPLFPDESAFFADCILHAPRLFGGATVYDLGSGTGILSLAARAAGAKRVHGIDISPPAVARASQAARELSMDESVGFVVGDWATMAPLPPCDVLVANPPFVPAPHGGRLPQTSFGGYRGAAETERILDLADEARHVVLLSLTLRGQRRRCLVTSLLERRRPSASVTSVSLYGNALSLSALESVFEAAHDFQSWKRDLESSGFDCLDYRLFVASDAFEAGELVAGSKDLLKEPSQYSGSWEARLNRYRAWQGTRI